MAAKKSLPSSVTASKELVISLILFVILIDYGLASYLPLGSLIDAAFAILVVAFSLAYAISLSKRVPPQLMHTLFLASAVLFAFSTYAYFGSGQFSVFWFNLLEQMMVFVGIFTILMLIVSISVFVKNKWIRALLILCLLAIIFTAYYTNLIQYSADDETILGYYAAYDVVSGINPYTAPIPQILYAHVNTSQLTIRLNNTAVDTIDYPALYFLVQVPFYLAFNQGYTNINGLFMHAQIFVYFIVLLLVMSLIIRKDKPFSANFAAYVLIGMLLSALTSMVVLLMLSTVLMLYTDIGKKYGFLFIGIAASMQEQLWPFCMLFLLYYLNNYGLREGARIAAGAVAVFLIINGYFILSSPSAFISTIISTTGNIIPNGYSGLGSLLAYSYPIQMPDYQYLFLLALGFAAIATLYINRKVMIPLFSMIPFFFLNHAIAIYFVFPVLLFVLVHRIQYREEGAGKFRLSLAKPLYRDMAIGAVAAIILFGIALIQVSHAISTSQFNVQITNQSAYVSYNAIHYRATISYSGSGNGTVYLLMEGKQRGVDDYYGVYDKGLINKTLNCGYPCAININQIVLNSTGPYRLNATFAEDSADPIYVSAIVYDGEHYYKSLPVKAVTGG